MQLCGLLKGILNTCLAIRQQPIGCRAHELLCLAASGYTYNRDLKYCAEAGAVSLSMRCTPLLVHRGGTSTRVLLPNLVMGSPTSFNASDLLGCLETVKKRHIDVLQQDDSRQTNCTQLESKPETPLPCLGLAYPWLKERECVQI